MKFETHIHIELDGEKASTITDEPIPSNMFAMTVLLTTSPDGDLNLAYDCMFVVLTLTLTSLTLTLALVFHMTSVRVYVCLAGGFHLNIRFVNFVLASSLLQHGLWMYSRLRGILAHNIQTPGTGQSGYGRSSDIRARYTSAYRNTRGPGRDAGVLVLVLALAWILVLVLALAWVLVLVLDLALVLALAWGLDLVLALTSVCVCACVLSRMVSFEYSFLSISFFVLASSLLQLVCGCTHAPEALLWQRHVRDFSPLRHCRPY